MAQQSYDQGFNGIHQDHLGSGHKMTNTAGTVVFTEQYDPHGQKLMQTSNNGAFYLSKKFTGYERDYGTNTDNAKVRQYHHNNGRFMQADPLSLASSDLSDPQSLNLYSYVQNDPINNIDPSGMNLIAPDYWERAATAGSLGAGNGIFSPGIHSFDISTRTGVGTQFGDVSWGPWVTTTYFFAFGGGGSGGSGSGSGGGDGWGDTKAEDKLDNDQLPDPEDPNLDDCHKKGEALRDVFKSVRRRHKGLNRSFESYKGHAKTWAHQKNVLNKWITNFKDNKCDDKDLPPGVLMVDVVIVATATAPPIRSFRQGIDSGILVPIAVATAPIAIWFPALVPIIGKVLTPAPAR